MTSVYVVVMIASEIGTESISIDPVGAYSSMEIAFEYVEKLEKSLPKMQGECIFDIFEFELDEKPFLLEFFKTKAKIQMKAENDITKALLDLMKKGVVDQLIGEDGRFYYVLTEKGKETAKKTKIPQRIMKLINRNKKNEGNKE